MIIRPVGIVEHPLPVEESHVCFVSMVEASDGGYDAVYRNFSPANDIYSCSVRYQKYDKDLKLIGKSREIRKKVEDPRAFLWKGRSYAIAVDELSKGFRNYRQVIMDLKTGESWDLKTSMGYEGKNWMPVPDGERLYFIRSIDPLCVLECGDTWRCTMIIPPPGDERQIGHYRGGAGATMWNGIIRGYGRKGIVPHHTPCLFEIELRSGSMKLTDLLPVGFGDETILDPTCIIGDKVLLACSTKAWNHENQQIPTRICEITEVTAGDGNIHGR